MGDRVIEGDYQQDGAVCGRQAFTSEHVAWVGDAIDENLADLSPRAERFIRESPGAETGAHLSGSDTIRLYHDHVLVREPGTKQRTPWHQDQPYCQLFPMLWNRSHGLIAKR